ncbi:MAG: nicotinate-nucleotide--dimethylbenzimidazole phosphoribosyltransferase [Aquabacterium sp.]
MSVNRSLITPTSNPLLEQALHDKLQRRGEAAGSLGELEPVAVRLGLMQNSLKPRFRDPQVVVFAADHGLVVDGISAPSRRQTHEQVQQLLTGQLPLSVFARIQGMELSVVDCGVAKVLAPHEHLQQRKIAHGTRNARVGPAMSVEQAHAAIRAGMEIGDSLRGNLVACAGIGIGSHESAALVLSRLTRTQVRDLLISGPQMSPDLLAHLMVIVQGAQGRHREAQDAVEVLAAFGGFEIGVMVGVMLVAASKRHLIMVDGMAACAALMIASQIATAVTDYCVFCRSHDHRGLDHALALFKATALLELGMQSTDGTGATLAWPLLRSAAALLTDVAEGEDPGPSRPDGMFAPTGFASDGMDTPADGGRPAGAAPVSGP